MSQAEIDRQLGAALQARRAGHTREAAALFRGIVDRFGDHPLALNALGLDALAAGDPRGAIALFERAAAADPASPELRMNLARAFREGGDAAGEHAALDSVLAIDQRHFMALVRLAELHERVGETTKAAERWGNVLAMAPMIDERSPALDMMFEHARDVVTRQRAQFGTDVDAGLADARAGLPAGELRRFDACIDHVLGRRQIYANQCHGLHFPFLPADEFFEHRHFPWLEAIEAKTDVIRAELEAVLAEDAGLIRPYVAMAPGTPDNKWSPLDHSLTWGAMHLWKDGRRNDAVCARVPQTAAVVEALPLSDMPGRTPTVFFSILQPGAHLPAHTGVSNVRTIIHLPLIVPEGCTFRVGGETRAWEEGRAWAFDDTIEHEAWNRSDRPRAILIFDVWNPHIREAERALLREFYRVSDRVEGAPAAAIEVSE